MTNQLRPETRGRIFGMVATLIDENHPAATQNPWFEPEAAATLRRFFVDAVNFIAEGATDYPDTKAEQIAWDQEIVYQVGVLMSSMNGHLTWGIEILQDTGYLGETRSVIETLDAVDGLDEAIQRSKQAIADACADSPTGINLSYRLQGRRVDMSEIGSWITLDSRSLFPTDPAFPGK